MTRGERARATRASSVGSRAARPNYPVPPVPPIPPGTSACPLAISPGATRPRSSHAAPRAARPRAQRSTRAGLVIIVVAALLLASRLPLKPDIQGKLSPDLLKAIALSASVSMSAPSNAAAGVSSSEGKGAGLIGASVPASGSAGAGMRTGAQTGEPLHVWVYFRDKGETGQGSLLTALAKTRQTLSAHTAWRRSKVRLQANLVDYEDLPVSTAYADQVKERALRVRTVSRWLNALSVEAGPDQIWALAALDAVDRLDVVRAFRRGEPVEPDESPVPAAPGLASLAAPAFSVVPIAQTSPSIRDFPSTSAAPAAPVPPALSPLAPAFAASISIAAPTALSIAAPTTALTAAPTAPSTPATPGAPAASRNPIYGQAFAQLDQIKVPALHQQGLSGRGVMVCLLDVGFRWNHEVFRLSRLIKQWDFVFGDADVRQDAANPNDFSDAHGTATWSLLGGFKFGTMIGPAFGADILLGKTEVESSEKPIEEDYWAAGIEWAESLGAEVVSSSLGYTDWYTFKDMDGKTAVTTKAANRAVSLGVVVVNAAGNERRNAWAHIIAPSDGFGVIAVGAVDAAGKIASFSSPGPTYDGRIKPEVCAWGVSNLVAAKAKDGGDTYVTGSGTSYATPLVAGAVALLLEAHRDWTPAQVRNALMKTANNTSAPNNDYGWGIIDAAAAATYRPAATAVAYQPAVAARNR